jgi:hypothetical protein
MSGFSKHLVPLFDISAHNKALVIFVKLIEVIRNFLAACLYGKIGLPERDDFLARVAILHDKIASITGKLVICEVSVCTAPYFDHFADLSKMVGNIKPTVFAGKFCLVENL